MTFTRIVADRRARIGRARSTVPGVALVALCLLLGLASAEPAAANLFTGGTMNVDARGVHANAIETDDPSVVESGRSASVSVMLARRRSPRRYMQLGYAADGSMGDAYRSRPWFFAEWSNDETWSQWTSFPDNDRPVDASHHDYKITRDSKYYYFSVDGMNRWRKAVADTRWSPNEISVLAESDSEAIGWPGGQSDDVTVGAVTYRRPDGYWVGFQAARVQSVNWMQNDIGPGDSVWTVWDERN
ncbi:MAG: hypothetical protein HY876_11015 [Coriobacteriales bacterium]|nr:hypothetical protein [Coriobacteriales bacterium]